MKAKDNTCPTCHGRGTSWKDEHSYMMHEQPDFPCPTCSGQQDKYANNPPKTYEEKQQDRLKPYKPGQQEDKPTIKLGDQTWYKDGVKPDSKPECQHEYEKDRIWAGSESCKDCGLLRSTIEGKPEKPHSHKNTPEIVNDENELHKKTQENVNKPDQPQYWACVDHAIGADESTADGRCASCRAVHVPADYRPSKPEKPITVGKLREVFARQQEELALSAITANLYLAGKWQSNQQEALKEAISGIEALIYQSYDMGFSDGFTARNKSLYRKSEAE